MGDSVRESKNQAMLNCDQGFGRRYAFRGASTIGDRENLASWQKRLFALQLQ